MGEKEFNLFYHFLRTNIHIYNVEGAEKLPEYDVVKCVMRLMESIE
jgi:hypothetical protein